LNEQETLHFHPTSWFGFIRIRNERDCYNVAVERRMGFTVEEVCSERRLTYEEIWGED
jgi:hypothetical protein